MSSAAIHIARFNALQGKPVSRARLKEMLSQVNGVAGAEEVATRLAKALTAMGGRKRIDRLVFTPIAPPKAAAAPKPAVKDRGHKRAKGVKAMAPKKATPAPTARQLSGLVKGRDLKGLQFKKIALDGEWRQIFGPYLYSDAQIGIYGAPGSGKTVLLLKFAKYLAQRGLKVWYVTKEEFGRSTLTEKIKQFDIDHDNLDLSRDLSKGKVENFDCIFLDSVNKLKFTLEDYEAFVEKHGPRIYIPVLQTIKSGDFKGGQEWEHEMDIFSEVVNRKFVMRKNRYDGSFAAKSEQLDMDHRVAEAKKRKEIRDQVRSATDKKAPDENTDPLVG